jgi:hypothetical protein
VRRQEPEATLGLLAHLKQNGTPEGAVERRDHAVENEEVQAKSAGVSAPAS